MCLCFGLALAIWQAAYFQGELCPWCECYGLEGLVHVHKQSPVTTVTGARSSCSTAEVTQSFLWVLWSGAIGSYAQGSTGAAVVMASTSYRSPGPEESLSSKLLNINVIAGSSQTHLTDVSLGVQEE